MLGLTDEVSCNDMRICRRIRKDQAISWACYHVDADTAEQHALSFRNELVSRTHKNFRLWKTEQSESHSSDALHTAHGHDFVRATDMRCVNDRRRNPNAGT